MMNESANSQLFRCQSSPFLSSKTTNPLKQKGQMAKKRFIPQTLSSSASKPRSELFQRDDVRTRPHASEIHGQMANSSRIALIVDFGRSRQSPDPDRNYQYSINTAIGKLLSAMLNCSRSQPYAANFRLNDCR